MKQVTHALTLNGRFHDEVKDPDLSPRELIEQRLDLLDGAVRYSLSLWRLPAGVPFDRVNLATWPQEYVQVAGSADGMTVEIRRAEQSGWGHYVVGRTPSEASASRDEVVIPWDGHEARLSPSEVFSAAEAADVFAHYYDTGQVPDTLSLRPLA